MEDNYQIRDATQFAGKADCDRPATPLDTIDDLAAQADRVANTIQSFIARCQGGGIGGESAAKEPRPSGHLSNLDRLAKSISRADELARVLSSIG